MNEFETMMRDPLSRRTFLARLSAAGLGAACLPLLAGCGGSDKNNVVTPGGGNSNFRNIPGSTIDRIVLNFALTLEILEADLYRQALNRASGLALTTPLNADPNVYTLQIAPGNVPANLVTAGFVYLQQFAYVEATHREFLKIALGSEAVQPNANGYQFPNNEPGADLFSILSNILPLEETGVRAYLGAAPFLNATTGNPTVQTAVSIYSTEARHSAAVAYIVGRTGPTYTPEVGPVQLNGDKNVADAPGGHPNVFEKYLDPNTVLTTAQSTYFK